jgi:hypothetical protein
MFLKEYCSVMQPLAYALDILQAETKCFIGYLLPTLASLRTKLTGIKPTLKLTVPLINAVLSGLDARFQGYDIRHDLIIASVTLPQFRMRWIEDNESKNQARTLLYEQLQLNAAQQLAADSDDNCESSSQAASDDDFFHLLLSRVETLMQLQSWICTLMILLEKLSLCLNFLEF